MNLRVAVLTVSDRSAAGERPDRGGPALGEAVEARGWTLAETALTPDDAAAISERIVRWCDEGLDVVLTTGGTGFGPRDVTPEATKAVLEREAPGLPERIRRESEKTAPAAALSRGVCGLRGRTLILNLPGSPKGAVESLGFVAELLPHAVSVLRSEERAHPCCIPTKP